MKKFLVCLLLVWLLTSCGSANNKIICPVVHPTATAPYVPPPEVVPTMFQPTDSSQVDPITQPTEEPHVFVVTATAGIPSRIQPPTRTPTSLPAGVIQGGVCGFW
jgi:hypothetical protein